MNTVILVLLCLAIAGRELYLASDKRLPRAQAELRDLRAQLAELARRHETLQADVAEAAAPSGIPIPQPDASDRLDGLHDRVERLEKTTGDLSEDLAGFDTDRDAQRALARSLDTVERDVRELQHEMLDRLDREEGVVDGLLLSEEGEAEALLADAYEGCASEYGLRVRVRDPRPDGGWLGTAYRLSGMRADALAEELFSYTRGLYAPDDPSALGALLTELAQLRGGGVARFGPFTAVRTQSALLCGLLPDGDVAEPWELAGRIRELPDDRRCDLSWLRADD
ncbi:hypothetical protein BJF79_48240 [Actinomadura sp. CNU-125]|uniref:hypothetical protein n=1 Tax=Actinomadura sp. CNU-125 TaxID=1904961 RepID=UPI00095B7837|nr:hypothetical protein [Actinomadura sp. CNU-125]OLT18285.1 hypothetical protein BJF79_48240 [Actinomadura sp. CNU-125]